MICESQPWKMELARYRRSISTWSTKTHTNRGYRNVEKGIFLSAFIARKLIENRKIADRIRNKSMRCKSFKPFRPLSDLVSRFTGVHTIERDYDLARPRTIQISLFDLASEIMHCYVFIPEVNDRDELISFFINSYRNRDDRVLSVNLNQYCEAIDLIVSDDVQSARIWKDPVTGRVHAELN
jgi:hypothetical protein